MTADGNMSRFFVVDDPLSDRAFRPKPERQFQCILDETGYGRSSPPETLITLSHGKGEAIPGDVVWPFVAMPPLISDRLKVLLEQNQITGWDSFPVAIVDRGGALHQSHHRLMIIAKPCGPINWMTGDAIAHNDYPREVVFRGASFDDSTWDGSDIFHSISSRHILVTDRVSSVLRSNSIRNITLTRLSDYETLASVLGMSDG